MEELFLSQGETKESKCGEVFRSILGKYSIKCSHCYLPFVCLREFSEHIEEHYQLIGIATVNKEEFSEHNEEHYQLIDVTSVNELKDTFEIVDDVKKENLIKNKKEENLSVTFKTDNLLERRKIINNQPLKQMPIKKKSVENKIRIVSIRKEMRKIVEIQSQPEKKNTTKKQKEPGVEKKIRIKNIKTEVTKKQKENGGEKKCRNKTTRTEVKPIQEWICDICSKKFSTKYNVGYHIMSIHYKSSEHTPFLCDECGKSFATKSLLRRHSTVHTGERRFSCNICHRTFTEADKMRIHTRNVHAHEKPYSCSWEGCDKKFGVKKYLRYHEFNHAGIKNFKCNFCDLKFVRPGGRHAHEKSAHRF